MTCEKESFMVRHFDLRLLAWGKALAIIVLGGINGVGAGCLALDIDSLLIANGEVGKVGNRNTSYIDCQCDEDDVLNERLKCEVK